MLLLLLLLHPWWHSSVFCRLCVAPAVQFFSCSFFSSVLFQTCDFVFSALLLWGVCVIYDCTAAAATSQPAWSSGDFFFSVDTTSLSFLRFFSGSTWTKWVTFHAVINLVHHQPSPPVSVLCTIRVASCVPWHYGQTVVVYFLCGLFTVTMFFLHRCYSCCCCCWIISWALITAQSDQLLLLLHWLSRSLSPSISLSRGHVIMLAICLSSGSLIVDFDYQISRSFAGLWSSSSSSPLSGTAISSRCTWHRGLDGNCADNFICCCYCHFAFCRAHYLTSDWLTDSFTQVWTRSPLYLNRWLLWWWWWWLDFITTKQQQQQSSSFPSSIPCLWR